MGHAALTGVRRVVEGEGMCVQGGVGDAGGEQLGHRGGGVAGRGQMGCQVGVGGGRLEAAGDIDGLPG
ncbi:hypothetical protein ACH4RA_18895 [Streptomyces smyrnaeus]|uniref:hypothetical protein n=1 Tax=Streptomyces TaxID=1883 RepID=UPI001B3832E9|nr:hypothetical protein [Streptomyces sp. RK75]MBQ0865690.1 hypothetical protein [Streptomyces sp. RK75]